MKRSLFAALCLLSILFGSAGSAWAERWRDLPPEERREMRQQMREHWQQAPPRREFRRDDEGRGWQQVPPEERRRMRDEMREHRRERHGRDERRW